MGIMHTGSAGMLSPVIIGLLLVWFAVSTGLLSMLFPSIIDGYSVFESTKRSIRMSIKYFDRVFGVWMTFLLILGVIFVPIIAAPLTLGMGTIGLGIMAVYMLPANTLQKKMNLVQVLSEGCRKWLAPRKENHVSKIWKSLKTKR